MPSFIYSGPFGRPWIPQVGYVLHASANRKEELEEDYDSRGECSEIIPEVPEASRRRPSLCLLSFVRGAISHVARAEVRYKARSGNDRIDIWDLKELSRPVSIARLRALLKEPRTTIAKNALKNGGHLPPKAFESVLGAFRRFDEAAFQAMESLYDRERVRLPSSEQSQTNWGLQRDAVLTALDIAKIPRGQLASIPAQLPQSVATSVTSIFDDLGAVRGLEDILVLHDLRSTDGWEAIRDLNYPARTFTSGDVVLTVILANKFELERQLGVDLIYVNETLKSVVFVQYKVMRGVDGEEGYRPDPQLKEEIDRMDRVEKQLALVSPDVSCDSYRLCTEPFFLKFCRGVLEHHEPGLVPGHYVPLDFWRRVVVDPRVRGPLGGIKITPSNLPRYFTATDFKDLVARGWIGTTGLQAEIIVPLIKEMMKSGRTVALAIKSTKPVSDSDAVEDSEGVAPDPAPLQE